MLADEGERTEGGGLVELIDALVVDAAARNGWSSMDAEAVERARAVISARYPQSVQYFRGNN